MEVRSHLVDKMPKPAPAGAIEIRRRWYDEDPAKRDEIAGLEFGCPCGCGNNSWLPLEGPQAWTRDTSKSVELTELTLTPSILQTFDCKWHGYLTDGVFRSC